MTDNTAPFGLIWGATEAQLTALGVELTGGDDGQNGKMYIAKPVPKPIADIESVAAFLSDGGKLWRIVGIFKSNTGDPFGASTLKRYSELKDALAKRYGRPNESKLINPTYSAENFVLGISAGENYLYSDFVTDDLFIQLAIRAGSLGESFCIIFYECRRLKSEFEQERRTRELDAL